MVYMPSNDHLELIFRYIQQLIVKSLGKLPNKILAYLQISHNLFTVKEKSQYIGHEEDIYTSFQVIQHLTANGRLSATNSDSVTKYRFG